MKTGESVLFQESDIPCLVILQLKKSPQGNLGLSVTMYRYTRYYVNESGGGENGPVYRASFRVNRGNGIGSFLRELLRFVKRLLYSGANALR